MAEHAHDWTQVSVSLDDAECEVAWLTATGERVGRMIDGKNVWVVPAGLRHSCRLASEAATFAMYFDGAWMLDVAGGTASAVSIRPVAEYSIRDPLIGGLVDALQVECCAAPLASREHAVALGAALGARVLRAQTETAETSNSIGRRLNDVALQRVQEFIASNLSEKIPLAALAREGRYSPGHFSRLFKRSTGLTPEQYVLRARLLAAKELLGTGNHTVSEVAYRVGFCDHSHFTTQFKRLFGAVPKSCLAKKLRRNKAQDFLRKIKDGKLRGV